MSFIELETSFVWQCNNCPKQVIFPPSDFYGQVDELKARGWSFHLNDDGSWDHTCGYCNYKHRQTSIMDRTFSRPREVKG
jgi:hypothetical protein